MLQPLWTCLSEETDRPTALHAFFGSLRWHPIVSILKVALSCCAGQDQTRGWFYTLMVLSTALFNRPAFKNLVCNGLVLADDGKKMSKRLKNYPVRLPARPSSFSCLPVYILSRVSL